MAQKRTIDIDIKNNADETAKDFDNLSKATDRAAKSADNLDATFEEVYGELQPLTTRMGEAEDRLYELALAGDTTSKEYQELLTKVGQYRKVQIQTDLAVDQAATTMSQKLGTALTGATSGFAAVQGVMALTGGESEALEKSLLKVQGAMAFQQGVQGVIDYSKSVGLAGKATQLWSIAVGGTTGAMKLLRLALISTGIGALVVLLGTLIANQDKVSKGAKGVVKATDEMSFGMRLLLAPIVAVVEAYKALIKAAQFLGLVETEEEIANKKRAEARKQRHQQQMLEIQAEKKANEDAFNARQSQFDREIAMMEALGKSSFALRQQKIQDSIATNKQELKDLERSLGVNKSIAAQLGKAANFTAEQLKEMRQGIIDLNESIADSENQLLINEINNNKKKANSYKQYISDKKAADEKSKAETQKELDDEINAEIAHLKTLAEIKRANEDALRTDEENELLRVEEKYDALEASAFGNAEALNEIEIARLNARNEILLKYDNEAYDAKKALDDKAAADEKERLKQQKDNLEAFQEAQQSIRMQNIDNALSGIAVLKDLAGENRKLQAATIAAESAVGIAKIIMNTQAANAAATLKYAAIPGGIALAAAERTANSVSAGINIAATIAAATKGISALGGGASVDNGGGVGGDAGGGEQQAPSFNVVGDSGINQLAQLQQQPVQAFVVSGEVTTSQALDRNRVENATL